MTSSLWRAVSFLVLAVTASPPADAGELVPVQGAPAAPALELADPAGARHAVSGYRGRVVLVNFWASWCPPCLQEMPSLQRLARSLAGRPLEVLAVNVGEAPGRAREALRRLGYDGTLLLDPDQKAFADWGVKVLPSSFLVDAGGRVRFRALGALEWDGPGVVAAIEELMRETRPDD